MLINISMWPGFAILNSATKIMSTTLNRSAIVAALYDYYAGALLNACFSFTKDYSVAQQAILNTFNHFNKEFTTGNYSFGLLYRQARKECLLLMTTNTGSYSSIPNPVYRVVAEMICVRGYSIADTAKLLNRSPGEINGIVDCIKIESGAEEIAT